VRVYARVRPAHDAKTRLKPALRAGRYYEPECTFSVDPCRFRSYGVGYIWLTSIIFKDVGLILFSSVFCHRYYVRTQRQSVWADVAFSGLFAALASWLCEMNTLYVSDLDGTLLRDDATLSAFSRDVLRELLCEDIAFTVASARSVASIRAFLAGLEFQLPIIEFNGAFISDLESGRHLIIHSIEPAIVEDIYQLSGAFNCIPFVSTFDGAEDRLYYSAITNAGMRWYVRDRQERRDRRLRAIEDLTLSFRDEVVCLTVIGAADVLFELDHAVKERHLDSVETHCVENRYSPGWYWLTVHDHRATKDRAIRIVLDEWGLDGSEIVVFGDSGNDIKMFQLADRAIAVANATDELKGYATQVIGSNNEDSVARFIRSDWGRQSGENVAAQNSDAE